MLSSQSVHFTPLRGPTHPDQAGIRPKLVPPIWSPETHHTFPREVKAAVRTLLLINLSANHDASPLSLLPRDVLIGAIFPNFPFAWQKRGAGRRPGRSVLSPLIYGADETLGSTDCEKVREAVRLAAARCVAGSELEDEDEEADASESEEEETSYVGSEEGSEADEDHLDDDDLEPADGEGEMQEIE